MSTPTQVTVPPSPDAPKGRRLAKVLKWALPSLAIAAATLIVVLAIVPPRLATESNANAPLDDAEPMRFRFLDRTFAVPRSYQPNLSRYGEGETFSFMVWALLPEFGPDKTARNQDSILVGNGKPGVQVIVTIAPMNMPPDDLVRRKIEPVLSRRGQRGPAGLRRYDIGNNALPVYAAAYVPKQTEDAVYIGCYIVSGTPKLCTMEAIYEHAALMEVVFDGDFLADWRETVSGARRLVKSFEVQPQ